LEQKGLYDDVISEIDKFGDSGGQNLAIKLLRSRIFAKGGKKDEARRLFNEAISKNDAKSHPFLVAQSHIAFGENEKAVKILERIIPLVEDNIYAIKYESNLDPIRNNPLFAKVLREKEVQQGW